MQIFEWFWQCWQNWSRIAVWTLLLHIFNWGVWGRSWNTGEMKYKESTAILVLTELLALFVLFYLYQLWYICIQEYDWMKEFIAKRKWHYLFLRPKATAFSPSWDLNEANAAETICLARHYELLTGEHSLRPPCLTCKITFSQQAGPQILSEVLHILEGSSEGKDRLVSSGNKLSLSHWRVGENNSQS